MFVAEVADTRVRVSLPGHRDVEASTSTPVDPDLACKQARAGLLRCSDRHCDAPLAYTNGSRNEGGDLVRRPHWRHPVGSALDCAASGSPEGIWHQFVKLDVLGRAESHETLTSDGGARCDAVVRRRGGGTAVAVEVQHSQIATATIRRRHTAHQAANLESTLWIVDGRDLVTLRTADLVGWSDPTVVHPGRQVTRGLIDNLIITRTWVADLIKACQDTTAETGYTCTVGILVSPDSDRRGTQSLLAAPESVLRFVTDAEIMVVDGQRTAVVHTLSRPVTESALRLWSAGPARGVVGLGHPLLAEIRCLDAAGKRSIKNVHAFFDIAHKGGRVRIGFTALHHDHRVIGTGLGLIFAPDACNSLCGGGHVAHLVGARTPAVDRWLATGFGEDQSVAA